MYVCAYVCIHVYMCLAHVRKHEHAHHVRVWRLEDNPEDLLPFHCVGPQDRGCQPQQPVSLLAELPHSVSKSSNACWEETLGRLDGMEGCVVGAWQVLE